MTGCASICTRIFVGTASCCSYGGSERHGVDMRALSSFSASMDAGLRVHGRPRAAAAAARFASICLRLLFNQRIQSARRCYARSPRCLAHGREDAWVALDVRRRWRSHRCPASRRRRGPTPDKRHLRGSRYAAPGALRCGVSAILGRGRTQRCAPGAVRGIPQPGARQQQGERSSGGRSSSGRGSGIGGGARLRPRGALRRCKRASAR